MIKLVNQSPGKRFGIVLGDRLNATMESVGCICEIRQYVPLPTRHRILVDAKAIGRFRVHKILLDKPFVTVRMLAFSMLVLHRPALFGVRRCTTQIDPSCSIASSLSFNAWF
jgi:Lon protease-like protein